jgi:adenosylcobinamide-GDP ribazoletransferase
LLEATALAALVSAAQVAEVAAAFALARSVAPAIAGVMPYAREGHGLARALTSRARAPVAVGVACAVVLAVRPRDGLELVGCAALCAVGAAAFCRSRFGGVTGDTLGGTIAVTEVGCLLVACIR